MFFSSRFEKRKGEGPYGLDPPRQNLLLKIFLNFLRRPSKGRPREYQQVYRRTGRSCGRGETSLTTQSREGKLTSSFHIPDQVGITPCSVPYGRPGESETRELQWTGSFSEV